MTAEPAQPLVPLPRLDDLAAEPATAATVPTDALPALLHRAKAAVTALEVEATARLLRGTGPTPPAAADEWLPLVEAARQLGVPPDRLRRTWKRYPFARKVSRKAEPVFDRRGLQAWLAMRRPR